MNPSLALIPCAFDTGKLYSVLPSDGTGDFTVSRNGSATYLGSDGLLKTAQPNEARLEFNTDGTFKGVLVEPAATNLFIRSDEFDHSSWNKVNLTIQSNTTLAPDGTLSTEKLVESNTLPNQIYTSKGVSLSGTEIYTFSVFAKKSERIWLRLSVLGSKNAWFNLDTGVIGTVENGVTAKIIDIGNGWYRCSVTAIRTNNTSYIFLANANNNITYSGDGTSGIYLWGAQLELGSVATSYIPTVASTVTRPADVIQKTGIADLIGQTEGSVYLDFILARRGSDIFFFHPRTSNNMIISVTSDGRFLASFYNQSVAITFTPSFINNVGQRVKVLFKYKTNDIKLFANGNLLSQNLTTTINLTQVLSDITLNASGAIFAGTNYKTLNSFYLFKTALTDAQAIALTTL